MTLSIKKDKTALIRATTKLLVKNAVYVGVPESENARDDGPIGNAALAYLHDTGSPANNIPARPFLATGIAAGKAAIVRQFERAGKAALDGKAGEINAALNAAGLAGQSAVQRKITEGPFAPLSEKTIKARQRKGRTGTKPLLDTGELRRSISYVIRKS